MSIKQKIRDLVVSAAIAASMMGGAQSPAYAANSAEIMVGNNSTTLDVKTNAELAKKVNLFARNRTTVSDENKVGYFGLADLSYNIVGGLDAVLEEQFVPGSALIPRIGVEYFEKLNDISVFCMGTAYINKNTDLELLQSINYNKNLTPSIGLAIGAENIVNFGENGLNYGIQRARAGLSVDKIEFGGALDLSEAGGTVSKNVGAYVKIKF